MRAGFNALMNKAVTDTFKIRKGSVEGICLDCPLPAKKCRPSNCKRFNEELKKLKEKL
jgi:hypothetical protein